MKAKKKVSTLINQEELPETVRRFANAMSQIKAIESEIEIARQDIVRKYENKLAKLNEIREETFDALQTFSEHHRDDIFTDRKSMDLAHGTIGFRLGTPKLDKEKKMTWDMVVEELEGFDKSYIKVAKTVNKELIIANRKDADFMLKMNKLGIDVVQDETFFVEAKEENLVTA